MSTTASSVALPDTRLFPVKSSVFKRMKPGTEFSEDIEWQRHLSDQVEILQYAEKNPSEPIVLQDEETGSLLRIQRPSGGAPMKESLLDSVKSILLENNNSEFCAK